MFAVEHHFLHSCTVSLTKTSSNARWSSPPAIGRGMFHLHSSVDGITHRSDIRFAAMTATQTEHLRPSLKSIADYSALQAKLSPSPRLLFFQYDHIVDVELHLVMTHANYS